MCVSALFALSLMLIHVDRGWNLNAVEYSKHFYYKRKADSCFCVTLQSCSWRSQIGHRLVVGNCLVSARALCCQHLSALGQGSPRPKVGANINDCCDAAPNLVFALPYA